MRYLLISLLAFGQIVLAPNISYANFSGLSMTESPVESVETIIDQVVKDSKLDEKMAESSSSLKALKNALIKGALKDNEVLRSLVKFKSEILPSIKDLPDEQQLREYAFSQHYLKNTAEEFGYSEHDVTLIE